MSFSRIYSAVYSGVPVFEMVVQGVAVMRRRADSYMNATQILKVAGIEKGKRTKILEREVLSGEHEKVQGGYGKYQGTWIPCAKGRELAERYNVMTLLAPLFDFDISTLTNENEEEQLPTKEQAIAAQRRKQYVEPRQSTTQPSTSNATNGSPGKPSTGNRSSNLSSTRHSHAQTQKQQHSTPVVHEETRGRKKAKIAATSVPNITKSPEESTSERHRRILMAIFLSDNSDHIPELLKDGNASSIFNIDLVIDDQGHTALHWAAALARIKTVELLVSKGADICRQNYAGETPLMRAVMVTNSYDNESFPSILAILEDSVRITDQKNRTVLHHSALTAGVHTRMNAALFYTRNIIRVLTTQGLIKPAIDVQDNMGDTALTIAARLDCSEMIELLIQAGANSKTENKIGLVLEDYQSKDDRTNITESSSSKTDKSFTATSMYAKRSYGPSQRGREIVSTVQRIVDALDEEYSGQLTERDQELQQTQEEFERVTKQLDETRKTLEERQAQSQQLSETYQTIRDLEGALQTGWAELEEILQNRGDMPHPDMIDSFDENEDIDALFDVPVTDTEDPNQLQLQVQMLQARIEAYKRNDKDLESDIQSLRTQAADKEMHCKRLIAACCNLSIDKIDELVKPLTQAIESDPPDLDLARVIGFMEKIKRQGTFPDYSSASSSGSGSIPGLSVTSHINNGQSNGDSSKSIEMKFSPAV
ncbi:apses-type HTH transcription regulator [Phycomyces blakesleeanus NRRL 1555(-)]|uniref:Apses-type HTH transcription regulator n=1 Tax=Phycomyces blakesleeanus (strain ATCC 8743b / DSM 1359 / FGSC 10004 / NBRC 33097 / NRRL 1555) TaxID=763407 RepID=A0A162TUA4_PHYB8|nr:apses-type HTH transcription regulator [Phycomyces blakesleeanus NRRL 1555(-)]OAD69883.1 apses-type HTH transcription regulator [Phycomyces blakesleeanus NRRL 1555(-)]|eukprot:XP_018287923.1 apses-type HTH transcription regulator [Phycomyces blakesleeanus NRRL 1555(-)]